MTRQLVLALTAASILALGACARAPREEIKDAKAALMKARAVEADTLAPETFRRAESALDVAMAEIDAQQERSFLTRDYDRAVRILQEAQRLAERSADEVHLDRDQPRRAATESEKETEDTDEDPPATGETPLDPPERPKPQDRHRPHDEP